jgi:hypothetical protein
MKLKNCKGWFVKKRYDLKPIERAFLLHELNFSDDEIDTVVDFINLHLDEKISDGSISENRWNIPIEGFLEIHDRVKEMKNEK